MALPGVQRVEAMHARGNSVWLVVASRIEKQYKTNLLRSVDGGATWRADSLPSSIEQAQQLHRTSDSAAFLVTMGMKGSAPLWQTFDAGRTWTRVSTPHDQQLHTVAEGHVRIQQVAIVGRWIAVREFDRAFISPIDRIQWKPLKGVAYVAADPVRQQLYLLTDSLAGSIASAGGLGLCSILQAQLGNESTHVEP